MAVELTAHLDPELPIIEALLEGDHQAFGDFVQRNSRWVRGVIYGVLGDAERVEDVLQVVWTTVWQQVHTLSEPARWRTWLYRLARNAAVDAGRETSRRRGLNRGFARLVGAAAGTQECKPAALAEEERRQLTDAIRSLPSLYREPFVLRHLEGWSYQEIASVFDMPVDTVETRLVRARRQLRNALQGKV